MRLDIDHCAVIIALTALSLLFIPAQWFIPGSLVIFINIFIAVAACYYLLTNKTIPNLIFILALIINGLGYFHYQAAQVLQISQQIAHLPNKIKTQWQITEILQQQDFQQFIAQVEFAHPIGKQSVLLDWQLEEKPQLGQVWQGELRLRALSSRLNEGGFDRQQWSIAKGIRAQAKVKTANLVAENIAPNLRQKWLQRSLQQTQGLTQQGLLLALAFGERAWLDKQAWKAYQKTNTAHLIAISGLHIGLAMSLGYWLARGLQILLPTTWINPIFPLLTGMLLANFYAYLAGLSIPTLRAVAALLLIIVWQQRGYYVSPWRLFIRGLALLLLWEPMMMLSSSFWLSLLAVACLIFWYQVLPLSLFIWRGQPLSQHRCRYLWGLLHLQLGLFLLFTPIQVAFFAGFSHLGWLANIIAVPYFSLLLVPLLLLIIILQVIGDWHLPLLNWERANQLAEWINNILATLQDYWQPFSDKQLYYWILATALILTAILYWVSPSPSQQCNQKECSQKQWLKKYHLTKSTFMFYLNKHEQPVLWQGPLCVAVGIISLLIYQGWKKADWQLQMLDVGQGLAILISKDGYGTLYDTGASWQGGSMAQIEILPLLARQGIELEQLILSHDDNDHAGGVPDVLQAFPHVQFISSSQQEYKPREANSAIESTASSHIFCQQGKHWYWHDLHFEVLAPTKTLERAANTDSCVIRVSDNWHSVLLTGDADKIAEKQFIPQLKATDILQVGHHGSKTSTSVELLEKLQPKLALVSIGRWNPWHFPHEQVTTRLASAQIPLYNSAELGQVSLSFYANSIHIDSARHAQSPWYRSIIGELKK